VTQAGDPQTQRVKRGSTGLVWFYGRGATWEKAESALAVAWIFPADGLAGAAYGWRGACLFRHLPGDAIMPQ
jgi:hypothetical protein